MPPRRSQLHAVIEMRSLFIGEVVMHHHLHLLKELIIRILFR